MQGGAVRYIYKFPLRHAFKNSQSAWIPGSQGDPQWNMNNIEKFVSLAGVKEMYRIPFEQRFEASRWMHTDAIYNHFGLDVLEKDKWPIYMLLLSSEPQTLYIVHPHDNKKVQACIDGRDYLGTKMDEFLDELRWHPVVGSKVAEFRNDFEKRAKKKQKVPGADE